MTTGPVDATPGGQVAAVPSGVARFLARYAELVLAGLMGSKPPIGWHPQHWLHPDPTDPAPGSDAAPTPARRGTTT